jgi:tRNA pseudouridine38-40 synthase
MLLKFAYDGRKFYGYQRQKDVPTVEGSILRVLQEYGIASKLRSASRTDRGVSALGNVIHIHTSMDAADVIGILNANLEHIYFHSFAMVDLNPRHAELRWYRYHLLKGEHDITRLREAAEFFQGMHDFRNFTRARKNTVLEIKKIEVKLQGELIVIDFYARNYLWNLIRRLVAAMEKYSLGMNFGEEIFTKRFNFGIAPPEPLVLMDVKYSFPFENIDLRKRKREFSVNYLGSMIYYYLANFSCMEPKSNPFEVLR